MKKMKLPPLTAVIEEGEDGYFVATCPELDVMSQGKTRKDAEVMIGMNPSARLLTRFSQCLQPHLAIQVVGNYRLP
jgi:hypothetical protein